MAEINLETITLAEIETWLAQLSARYNQLRAEAENEAQNLKTQIGDAVTKLDTLIGKDGVKNTTTIKGVLQYAGKEMVAAGDVALPLAFRGLLEIAQTLRQVSASIAADAARNQ